MEKYNPQIAELIVLVVIGLLQSLRLWQQERLERRKHALEEEKAADRKASLEKLNEIAGWADYHRNLQPPNKAPAVEKPPDQQTNEGDSIERQPKTSEASSPTLA